MDDIRTLDADRFFSFVDLLIAYKGALRFKAEKDQQEKEASDPRNKEVVKDSNQWFSERMANKKPAAAPSKDTGVQHDPSIDPEIAKLMERGTG